MAEDFGDTELRVMALEVAADSRQPEQNTGSVLVAADQVYRFLTGGTVVVSVDGLVGVEGRSRNERVPSTRH